MASAILSWLTSGMASALWALREGTSGFGFFLLFLSPLLAGLILISKGKNGETLRHRLLVEYERHRPCPSCSEAITSDATRCQSCGWAVVE